MIVNEKNSMPYMKSLASCLNHIIKEGYSEEFTVTEQGLEAIHQQHYYHPDQIQVVNF